MKKFKTDRGFNGVEFIDSYGFPCKLQQSSAISEESEESFNNPGSSYVWLGIDRRKIDKDFQLPFDNELMHLSRDRVRELIDCLQSWLDTNDFGEQKDG